MEKCETNLEDRYHCLHQTNEWGFMSGQHDAHFRHGMELGDSFNNGHGLISSMEDLPCEVFRFAWFLCQTINIRQCKTARSSVLSLAALSIKAPAFCKLWAAGAMWRPTKSSVNVNNAYLRSNYSVYSLMIAWSRMPIDMWFLRIGKWCGVSQTDLSLEAFIEILWAPRRATAISWSAGATSQALNRIQSIG